VQESTLAVQEPKYVTHCVHCIGWKWSFIQLAMPVHCLAQPGLACLSK